MQRIDRRIALLQRLGRLREVERQQAVQRVAEAHGIHGKLVALGQRSEDIAAGHARREDIGDGGALAGHIRFLAGLDTICRQTAVEREKAHRSSQEALERLMQAERRRELASDRLGAARKLAEQLRAARAIPDLARKLKGR